MSSRKQKRANRENAQKSTGPVTEAGKAKVAQNAITHGLSAQSYLVPGEDLAVFEAFRNELLRNLLQPVGLLEEEAAEEMISIKWRLKRIKYFEAEVIEETSTVAERIVALNKLNRYERTLVRRYNELLEELDDSQSKRLEAEEQAREEAKALAEREAEQKLMESLTHEELYHARERLYVQVFMALNQEEKTFFTERFNTLDGFVLSKYGETPPKNYKSILFDNAAPPESP